MRRAPRSRDSTARAARRSRCRPDRIWSAVESALRSLVGSHRPRRAAADPRGAAATADQLRFRRTRSPNFKRSTTAFDDTSYRPTSVDVNAAREPHSSSSKRRSSPMRRRSSRGLLRQRHSPRHSRPPLPVATDSLPTRVGPPPRADPVVGLRRLSPVVVTVVHRRAARFPPRRRRRARCSREWTRTLADSARSR